MFVLNVHKLSSGIEAEFVVLTTIFIFSEVLHFVLLYILVMRKSTFTQVLYLSNFNFFF